MPSNELKTLNVSLAVWRRVNIEERYGPEDTQDIILLRIFSELDELRKLKGEIK